MHFSHVVCACRFLPTLRLLFAAYVAPAVSCLRCACCLLPTLRLLFPAYVAPAVSCLRCACCLLPTLRLLFAAYVAPAVCCLRCACCLLPTLRVVVAHPVHASPSGTLLYMPFLPCRCHVTLKSFRYKTSNIFKSVEHLRVVNDSIVKIRVSSEHNGQRYVIHEPHGELNE